MAEEPSLADNFEAMLRHANLVKAHKETQTQHKIDRYEFATKMIDGYEPSKEDLFIYLSSWAQYMIVLDQFSTNDNGEHDQLKYDCDHRIQSPLLEKHLRNRIKIMERRAVFAQTLDAALSQRAFFGVQRNASLFLPEAEDELLEVAAEYHWLPLEIAGLKLCLRFFDQPRQIY